MTVAELIDELRKLPPQAEVRVPMESDLGYHTANVAVHPHEDGHVVIESAWAGL